MENQNKYDSESERAKIGDEFSHQTLQEIQSHFPEATHSQGPVQEYDIIIPIEEYNYPKIECKVCGIERDANNRLYVKVPESIFIVSESKYVRIKYKNMFNEYSTNYFRISSLKKYYEKMKTSNNLKVVNVDNRNIIMWPLHLLEGMYSKIKTTEDLINNIKNNGRKDKVSN